MRFPPDLSETDKILYAAIYEQPGISFRGLCSLLPITHQAVSLRLIRMAERGLITKWRKHNNARCHYYPAGQQGGSE